MPFMDLERFDRTTKRFVVFIPNRHHNYTLDPDRSSQNAFQQNDSLVPNFPIRTEIFSLKCITNLAILSGDIPALNRRLAG